MKDARPHDCGFSAALAVIGGKWKTDILWELHVAPRRFGELKRQLPQISEKMLIQQLREMEADGVVHREVFAELPAKVVYSLTDVGASLNSVVTAMSDWGRQHRERSRIRAQSATGGS